MSKEKENNAVTKAKDSDDEIVAVQMLRNCALFYPTAEGRPAQTLYAKGTVHSFKRKQLKQLILIDLIRSRNINEQNIPPNLYLTLGQ
jgi:hypothetical protein